MPPVCYTSNELKTLGFSALGRNVQIDRTCQFHRIERIRIGSNVRIDAFCALSAGEDGIAIGNYVHLSAFVSMAGAGAITIADFCGLSNRVALFTSNDDYSGGFLTNPTVPAEFKHVKVAPVVLKKHVIVGCGSVILPGVTIGLGAAIGALTLVNKSVPEFAIVSGNPPVKIGERSREILQREREFLRSLGQA